VDRHSLSLLSHALFLSSPQEIYDARQEELYARAVEQYQDSPDAQADIDKALCRLELGPFHVAYLPYPETNNHIYHNHNLAVVSDKIDVTLLL
jgi:hypothetical protein